MRERLRLCKVTINQIKKYKLTPVYLVFLSCVKDCLYDLTVADRLKNKNVEPEKYLTTKDNATVQTD